MTNNQTIDKIIFKQINQQWQKVAMVVVAVLVENKAFAEEKVVDGIRVLIDSKMIEVQGDINQIRYSEIRLSKD